MFLVGYSLPLTDLVTAGLLQDSVDPDWTHLYVADHDAAPVTARLDRLGLGPVGTWDGGGAVAAMFGELADEAARDSCTALVDVAAADPVRLLVVSRPDGAFSTVVMARADGADVVLEVAGAWATLPSVTIPSATPAVSLAVVLPLLAGADGRLLVEDAGRRTQVVAVAEHRQDTGQGHGRWAVAVSVA